MSKVRWGILSTAKIGTEKVIPAMQQCDHAEVVAIASRNTQRAEEVAQELGISQAFGSYEDLLTAGEVDAIYNPLPNHPKIVRDEFCKSVRRATLVTTRKDPIYPC